MKEFVRTHKKAVLLGLSAMLLVAAAIGGTLAWLTSTPPTVVNTFVPGEVPNKIVETFNEPKTTKSNVKIQNIGNVPAYIRVALVPIWRDGDNGTGLATEGTYDITLNLGVDSDKWTYNTTDGFYYYNSQVQPGMETNTNNLTAALIVTCAPKTTGLADVYKGKVFELNVIAQSVQADGMGASDAQDAFDKALDASATSPVGE